MRRRSRIRTLGWFAAAALVALALLPGTIVEGAFAARATSTPIAAAGQQAEATPTPEPTPTPMPEASPSPDPTPTPEATPTPTPTPEATPTPTPTPLLEPNLAVIDVYKIIDADGNLDTVDDQTPRDGWVFELELTNGTSEPRVPASGEVGLTEWLLSYGPEGTTATVTEVVQEDYELLDVACQSDGPFTGELDGHSFTFDIDPDRFFYECVFFNASTAAADTRFVDIGVGKQIDIDGDLDTVDDRETPPSWEFEAAFQDNVEIISADPDFDVWSISHTGDSTRVVVTEVPQVGYRILTAFCIDADDALGPEIPTTLDGNSLSFEVSGSDPDNFPRAFFCAFINTPVVVGALPTLPPTHAATGSAAPGSDASRIMLVGLAALIASLLVLRSHRPAHIRR